jgi:hypothetical protein
MLFMNVGVFLQITVDLMVKLRKTAPSTPLQRRRGHVGRPKDTVSRMNRKATNLIHILNLVLIT